MESISSTQLPPGPAALLVDNLGDSLPLSASPLPESEVSSSASSENGSTSSSPEMSATTTIVTETRRQGSVAETTTETIEHTGAEFDVAAKFGKDGSISLKPVPGRGGSAKVKTRRTHTFRPRISRFDRDHPESQVDPFRGFWTLAWILMFVAAVRTGVMHYEQSGSMWGTEFFSLISEDGWMLALSDGVMVTLTFVCVPFVKLLQKGWIRYYWTGTVIQHSLQALFLATAVRWTFHRQWPWVQSGFLTLHTISMLMKVHSYCSYNGELSEKSFQLAKASKKLAVLVAKAGGISKVEESARTARSKESSDDHDGGRRASPSPARGEGWTRRPLKRSSSLAQRGELIKDSLGRKEGEKDDDDLWLLTWHSDPEIRALAEEVATLKEALTSTGVNKVQWPSTVTYVNYIDYLLVPTLVYELEYPRTDKIRPIYILEKTLATFGTLSLIVLIVEHYILPVSVHDKSFAVAALDLAIPFMINYLLIFYIIFECICNGFAELTRFGDREFYQDWWNSTSFDEFSRRWNVPVHSFLLRHVYTSTITTYRFSKFQAAFTTFLLSACVHELVMCVVTGKIRMYLFALQMGQLPLIMIGRLPIFKKYPALGNLFFWLGLLSGFPLLAVGYLRY